LRTVQLSRKQLVESRRHCDGLCVERAGKF
jgi:hypothetical protein